MFEQKGSFPKALGKTRDRGVKDSREQRLKLPQNQKHPAFKRLALGIALLVLFFGIEKTHSLAQDSGPTVQRIEIPSSINPVGSGARALGLGGAFIAVADDATAASWNPAGLIQLETPEMSIVGACFRREEDIRFAERSGASGMQDVSKGDINYLSAAYPFQALSRNMIVSINYQNLYDMTRHWKFPLAVTRDDASHSKDVEIEQKGELAAIGIAYCLEITPRLSFGLTLNVWRNGLYANEWEQTQKQTGSGIIQGAPFSYTAKFSDRYKFSGYNANIGILWNPSRQLTLGAVLKTPFTADLKHRSTEEIALSPYPGDSSSSEEDNELDMPMAYGAGVAYRFSDRLTASLDVYRTEWDDYILKDATGNKFSPINNKPKDEAGIDPTVQLRSGLEYLYITNRYVVPLRCGVFYDPAPAEGSPDDYYGFSFGSGIARGKFIFDAAATAGAP